jgi:hypothetical protein
MTITRPVPESSHWLLLHKPLLQETPQYPQLSRLDPVFTHCHPQMVCTQGWQVLSAQ